MSQFCPPEHFETTQMVAEPFQLRDAQQLFDNLLSDSRVTEYISHATHTAIEQTKLYIRLTSIAWNYGHAYIWALKDRELEQIVGLLEMRPTLPRIEFGLLTSQKPGMKRFRPAIEIFIKALRWASRQDGVYRMQVTCDPKGKSASFVERLGFVYEAYLTNWEARPARNPPVGDMLMFSMLHPFAQLTKLFEDESSATQSSATELILNNNVSKNIVTPEAIAPIAKDVLETEIFPSHSKFQPVTSGNSKSL
ncbi:MAG: Protein N-acetyltransferase, RimJ/RimL family [Glomeribacter sp. 1016415]|nr:Protein N-acetyltransferase, RimJ/RimL family [Glomeribacter sp. 1016415]